MESPVVFILFLATLTFTDLAHSQTIYASKNPVAVGSSVTLSSNVTSGGWLFNGRLIVITLNETYDISSTWEDRVTLNTNTSSLTINPVTLKDSGSYVLENLVDGSFSQLTLLVEEPVSNVTVQTNKINLVEFNDTAVLMCSVSKGTSSFYQWFNGSSMITANEHLQLSSGNSILTIRNVTRYDQGPYKCNVSNNVSNDISAPVNLNINYGPSNAKMTVMPVSSIYKGGSNITLSCSADSSPPAMITWMIDGVYQTNTSSIELRDATESKSGNYTCLIQNTVTLRFSSKTTAIQIVDPVKAVAVNLSHPASLGEMFSLSCEVKGAADMIFWWRNGEILISADNNNTAFSPDNKTLTITSAQHSDGGNYQCQAFNAVSNLTSDKFTVTIYYGPETPFVYGPAFAETGRQAVFNCSAESEPPSTFLWWFNGSIVANTSDYTTDVLSLNMSGEYTCMAINNVTGKNSTNSTTLTVIEAIQSVMIKNSTFPINNQNITLICEVTGHYDTISWMKDNKTLNMNSFNVSYMFYNIEKNMLHFTPVTKNSEGTYQCVATNKIGQYMSQYSLLVSDPIYDVKINAPAIPVKENSAYNLTCNVTGAADYIYWKKNGQRLHGDNRIIFSGDNKTVWFSPLNRNDSGDYYCLAFNATGNVSSPPYRLVVIYPIENVEVKAPMTPAIEGNSYNLACNVTGPAEYIYWMKNGEKLHDDNRTVFYMENKTLHLNMVQRYDNGNYCCVAINAFGNYSSLPYNLIVNYGPDTPIIYGPAFAETGSQANFSCSAMSVPPSQFFWWFNGSIVSNTSVYTTSLLSFNMSREYTCMAINNVTGKNSTNSTTLTVIEPIQSVMIKNKTIPINTKNLTLTCEVVGPYDTIYWMKDNTKLNTNTSSNGPSMSYQIENNTLLFTPVTLNSEGAYQCVATNKAGYRVSLQYNLLVNYGPLSLTISSASVSMAMTLICTADSRPVCDFYWFFNNLSTPLQKGPMIVFPKTTPNMGTYICQAQNPLTNETMYKYFTVTAHAPAIHFPYQGSLMMMVLFAFSAPVLFN
ncbi:carcinoembryonic antigen-related cell adhesion molecule 5-like [Oreochromis niloticus]|uniref:carcinoembryonic antigen-related cell adhesion molecule 5-like n=1 Tax=Oreochromis niloticus TaxID=8128 RepID=UPI000DF1A83C|nr:carcinoembryonic antigen-related cell adhesion molecule 5-like [Oreochromis niloticus]